jgi:excisionase family DNA binding protein
MAVVTKPPSPDLDAQVWTIEEVCAYLRCARTTLYLWVKIGRVPKPKRVGRRLLWEPAVIRGLVETTPRTEEG